MISYAQNFEDVMLSRALAHVEHGFYIDVGANDPNVDSVTRAFYDRGWNGINIEPVPQFHRMLCQDRPHDINLELAVGARTGTLHFYQVSDTGLSTADPALAAHYRQQGRQVEEQDIVLTTLDAVCVEHARQPIHFVKIDVEGGETQVLEGFDLQRWQPWILVIEATRPLTEIPSQAEWEPIVLAAGYEPVYFDGINRFYLAKEQIALRAAFAAPPNYFDGFVLRPDHVFSSPVAPLVAQRAATEVQTRTLELVTQTSLRVEAEVRARLTAEFDARTAADQATANAALEAQGAVTALREEQLDRIRTWARLNDLRLDEARMQVRDSISKMQQAQIEIVHANSEVHQLRERMTVLQIQADAQMQAMYASTSWRVTLPMRKTSTVLRLARQRLRQLFGTPRATLVRLVRGIVRGCWSQVRAHPALANRIRNWFARHPRGAQLVVSKIFAVAPLDATAAISRAPGAAGPAGAAPPGARIASTWEPTGRPAEHVRLTFQRALEERRQRTRSTMASTAAHPEAMS